MQRDLEVTFCLAARAARQGMGPNANVGYRRALGAFRAAVRLQLWLLVLQLPTCPP